VEHFHSGQAKAIAQGLDARRDEAKVFSDDGDFLKFSANSLEKFNAGRPESIYIQCNLPT